MEKYRDKYRISTTRFAAHDYAMSGKYFVTICTQQRLQWFGVIHDANVYLSPVGDVVRDEWTRTESIRPYVQLDEWVIMPDHFHAIIIINKNNAHMVETPRRGVSTTHPGTYYGYKPEWQPHSLGSIINQFKSKCTKRIRQLGYADFAWQTRYYERIIRNDRALYTVRRYIINNPLHWNDD